MKKYDLFFGAKGNGVTVANRLETENGDYKNIAHISTKGAVTLYDISIPQDVKSEIYSAALDIENNYRYGGNSDFMNFLNSGTI